MRLTSFITMAKPGIVVGNVIIAITGFVFGSVDIISVSKLLATIFGIGFVIASACVCNNYVDRDIDQLMMRTKNRVNSYLQITPFVAISYSSVLLILGIAILYFFTNLLALYFALAGFFIYFFIYTLWMKRHSHWGILVGSFSGATPPVVGYCAATDVFNSTASILFLLLTAWQMPHFLAISLYRISDYKEASIPVIPLLRGIEHTRRLIQYWISIFIIIIIIMLFIHPLHWFYASTIIAVSFFWLLFGIMHRKLTYSIWGRKMFLISLMNIFIISLVLCLSTI